MCCKFRGERNHRHLLVGMCGEEFGDQEVFPMEGFKDGQDFDRWRELQAHGQRDGMDNVAVIMA